MIPSIPAQVLRPTVTEVVMGSASAQPVGPPTSSVRLPQNENEWKQSLFRYFEKVLPEVQAIPEPGLLTSRGDILLRSKGRIRTFNFMVELKKGLNKKGELDRLKTQTREYLEKHGMKAVFIVICGDAVEQRFLHDLKGDHESFWGSAVSIYWKHDDGTLKVVLGS
jgi:hypothetical protein